MNIMSHIMVAQKITKGVLPQNKRFFVILGAIIPDLDLRTQPHRGNNLLTRIYNSQNKVKTAKTNIVKAYQLGVLLHYICDYFCYAHGYNLEISHGLEHIKYEIAMQKMLKNGFKTRLSRQYTDKTFMDFIIDTKKMYDTRPGDIARDLEYMMTISEKAVSELIIYLRKK